MQKETMKITPAFLIQEYNDEDKRRIQLVGGFYSSLHKGWFVSGTQYDLLERSINDPSVLPQPSVPTSKGVGIFIDDLVDTWKIHGNTFDKRDAIKRFKGARWNAYDKSWRIPKEEADRVSLEQALQ